MATSQFLIRNRHSNMWYSRIIIPQALRARFDGRREIRRSLGTSDKKLAKFQSLRFWVQCQQGFQKLAVVTSPVRFENTTSFIGWLTDNTDQQGLHGRMAKSKPDDQDANPAAKWFSKSDGKPGVIDMGSAPAITIKDAFGNSTLIDFGDPAKEAEVALQLQSALLEKSRSLPQANTTTANTPETETPFDEAVDLYINKLKTQGRKGRRLAPRTLIQYQDKLKFWAAHFNTRAVSSLSLRELGDIQNWLTRLPSNFTKRGLSPAQAVKLCKSKTHSYAIISDKTRAEYLGQLKAFLEYAYSMGFIANPMAMHIEIPNTKQSNDTNRLPFSEDDLKKIFPENYGVDFGDNKNGLDYETKYWFPLLALYSGARLEELGQLETRDIKTCPETKITYMMIDNKGVAADGEKKRTKNTNSVRPIPIHSQLIKLGFLDYVEKRQQDQKNKPLFNLERDNQGRMARKVGNWFSRMEKRPNGGFTLGYIERRGVKSKGGNGWGEAAERSPNSKSTDETGQRWTKSFHSFRHTVIDNLRGKKLANGEYIREEDISLVVGHEKNKRETANYGTDRMQLELRKAVIEAVSYEIKIY